MYSFAHHYNYTENRKMMRSDIPSNIKSLYYNSNHKIDPDVLPYGLIEIMFNSEYNQQIDINTFPESLLKIMFGMDYNQKLTPGVFRLCKKIESIEFGYSYNQKIDEDTLPKSLISIIFGHDYNKKLNMTIFQHCHHLSYIKFGHCYNKILEGTIFQDCHNLKIIEFGNKYNQIIGKNVLPHNLKCLYLGDEYNQKIDLDILPDSLENIDFGPYFSHPLLINGKSIFPNNMKEIHFWRTTLMINHKAFSHINNANIYLCMRQPYSYEKIKISNKFKILDIIDEILPTPIAEEITPYIFYDVEYII